MTPPRSDDVFRALADPTRRAIFERLIGGGELTVRALTDEAGVSQPAVSKHLGQLKRAGLVTDRPDGRQTYYSVQPQALAPLADWMAHYGRFWPGKRNQLEDLVNLKDK